MAIVVAVLFLAHGIAHLVGFAASFRLVPAEKAPHVTTLLGGRVDVGEVGIRVLGVGWLLLAAGFAVAAVALSLRAAWWPQVTFAVAALSLAMCIAAWPEARIGAYLDLVIVLALVAGVVLRPV